MELTNNLFTYATSELSQDAFICWLLSFAKECSTENKEIRLCAQKFLWTAIPELEGEDVYVNEILQQKCFSEGPKKSIVDVLVTINNQYKLIIEDKTGTSEHSNQLNLYMEKAKKEYSAFDVKGLYYKTKFQSDYTGVKDANYEVIDYKKMIAIMTPFAERITNNIWQDYYIYLIEFEKEAEKFKSLPIEKWNWIQIRAFYDDLKQSRFLNNLEIDGNYGYVSNPRGGFEGMWFGKSKSVLIKGVNCELYLQLQFVNKQLDLCLRLSVSVDESILLEKQLTNKILRDQAVYGEGHENLLEQYGFARPPRFGNGKTMIIGVYNKKSVYYDDAHQNIDEGIKSFLEILKNYKNDK